MESIRLPCTPDNATPQYIACGSQLVARHIRTQTRSAQTVRARASCFASRPVLSKHSRLSPLERALCSLFFANIASLHPPPAALRRRCPYCLSEASLRANVPSCLLSSTSYVLRRGVAGGYRGISPVLLFFCRRFLFQIKRKCRNAGSIHPLIRVRSEGRS